MAVKNDWAVYPYKRVQDLVYYYTSDKDKQTNWSPNNVRRLIISPDVIMLQKHVGSSTKGKYDMGNDFGLVGEQGKHVECMNSVILQSDIMNIWQQQPPQSQKGVEAIFTDYTFQLLEELVICYTPEDPMSPIPYYISDLQYIIDAMMKKHRGPKTLEGVMDTFDRLACITVFNGSASEFVRGLEPQSFDKYHLMCDDKFVVENCQGGNGSMTYLNYETWYKSSGWKSLSDMYAFDAKDGLLKKRMELVRSEFEKKEKLKLNPEIEQTYQETLYKTLFVRYLVYKLSKKANTNKPNLITDDNRDKTLGRYLHEDIVDKPVPYLNSKEYNAIVFPHLIEDFADDFILVEHNVSAIKDKILLEKKEFKYESAKKGEALLRTCTNNLIKYLQESTKCLIKMCRYMNNHFYSGGVKDALPVYKDVYNEVGEVVKQYKTIEGNKDENKNIDEYVDISCKSIDVLKKWCF